MNQRDIPFQSCSSDSTDSERSNSLSSANSSMCTTANSSASSSPLSIDGLPTTSTTQRSLWPKILSPSFGKNSIASQSTDHSSANSSTSTAEPVPELKLKIEALQSQASSSPLSIDGLPTTSTSQRPLWAKIFSPSFRRNSITPQSTDHSSATSQSREEDIHNNPIVQHFQEQDLGKATMGLVIPTTAAFLSPYAPTSDPVRNLVFSFSILGFAALWNGILLRPVLPRAAIIIEKTGAGLVLLAYCVLIGSLLPDYLVWIPYFCFLLILIPFFWSYYLYRVAH